MPCLFCLCGCSVLRFGFFINVQLKIRQYLDDKTSTHWHALRAGCYLGPCKEQNTGSACCLGTSLWDDLGKIIPLLIFYMATHLRKEPLWHEYNTCC